MGCKATKTGVLMKWLVCASIYVLLFNVLNLNKLYLLACFHIQITLWSLFDLQMYIHPLYFFIWSNSKLLCSGMQEYRNMYVVFNVKSSCVHVCVQILL